MALRSLQRVQTYAANCVACHGSNGQGTPLAPALNDPVIRTDRTADQLNKTISLGSPGTVMAGWNQRLSAAEIAQLVTLVQHWDQIPPDAIPEPPAQPIIVTEKLLATGQTLYAQNCSRCHGADGQGTRRAPALNVQTFFDKVTTDAAMIQIVSSGVPGTAMPAWGDRLSTSEIEAIVAYVRSWEATAPAVANRADDGRRRPAVAAHGQRPKSTASADRWSRRYSIGWCSTCCGLAQHRHCRHHAYRLCHCARPRRCAAGALAESQLTDSVDPVFTVRQSAATPAGSPP